MSAVGFVFPRRVKCVYPLNLMNVLPPCYWECFSVEEMAGGHHLGLRIRRTRYLKGREGGSASGALAVQA